MRQKNLVLPVQCKHCNAFFDLWYDLNEDINQEEGVDVSLAMQSFCWKCRREIAEAAHEEQIKKQEEELIFDFDE